MRTRAFFVALVALVACRGSGPGADAGQGTDSGPVVASSGTLAALAKAENLRRSKDVPAATKTSRAVEERRRAARALARIADGPAAASLVELLQDDDAEVVTWAAYGLGYSCKGHEDAHVKALAARASSLASVPASAAPKAGPRGAFPPLVAVARAIGRCASPLAEDVLVGWLRQNDMYSAPSASGLGDLAVKRKGLRPETVAALAAAAGRPAHEEVFHPLARVVPQATESQAVLVAARARLAVAGDYRILAIKTLAKVGKDALPDLSGVVTADKGYDASERAEAARGLATLGDAGKAAAAEALVKLVPERDPAFLDTLSGPSLGVVVALVEALGEEPPKRAEPALGSLSRLALPAGAAEPQGLARRLQEVRCVASLALARGAYDGEALATCAPAGSEPHARARLRALLRRPLLGPRKAAFLELARGPHLRIRELAVEGLAGHAELGDAAREVIAQALASDKGGLVATAAEAAGTHPERLLVLSAREKRAALDPKAPPPGATPDKELDPAVAKALEGALARPWPDDRYETKLALLDAAVALGLPSAKKTAIEACADANVTMRERAQKALFTLGETRTCDDRGKAVLAPEVDKVPRATKIGWTFPSGKMTITLEPELAPVTVEKIASLAGAGFYKGIVAHRVVPGFVVQLGDPDGDGYGGSGVPLRCETSPVPFLRGDVGMALAGRDTGSSQIFVTLSRTPHLDGEYARIGFAEGDFDRIAEGDVPLDVAIVP